MTKTIAYKIILGSNIEVQIDPEEIEKFLESIKTGNPCMLKRGLVNPSYFIGLVEDKKRKDLWLEDTMYNNEERKRGIPKLDNMFGEVPVVQNMLRSAGFGGKLDAGEDII